MRTTGPIERIIVSTILILALCMIGEGVTAESAESVWDHSIRVFLSTEHPTPAQMGEMERILRTPGDYSCEDLTAPPGHRITRTIHNITPDYAMTHYCGDDVCGGVSPVCAHGVAPVSP